MSVTVVIPVFGDTDHWRKVANRAEESALLQSRPADKVVVSEAPTLREARNLGAADSDTEWLIFLDADDELDYYYIEEMLSGQGDIRQPSTLGVVDGVEDPFPVLIPPKPLLDGNYIVIGAFLRSTLFHQVGGFSEHPMYEDWDLMIRCWLEGAEITACPKAIYRIHIRPGSRNQQPRSLQLSTYHAIRNKYLPEARRKGLI